MLTRDQFRVVEMLAENSSIGELGDMAHFLGMPAADLKRVFGELANLGYADKDRLTDRGADVLENYRVKRAVFMAAGFGSRLMPITINTPKPLVRINGKRIIETMLDALVAVGIDEIYIVRGYLAEQFDLLQKLYPMIRFIDNPAYATANNISSAVHAAGHLNNAYILDADLYLKNPKLITKYQYASNYLGVPVDQTTDWCLHTADGRIDRVARGGEHCYTWIGISYWTENDGRRLSDDVLKVYSQPGGKDKYWDLVPLECCRDKYCVGVRECTFDDIIEVDTLRELQSVDKSYEIH